MALCSTAYWREKADLVAPSQGLVWTRILLVYRKGQGRKHGLETGRLAGVMGEHCLEPGAFGEFQGLAGTSYQVFQHPKKKHANLHQDLVLQPSPV